MKNNQTPTANVRVKFVMTDFSNGKLTEAQCDATLLLEYNHDKFKQAILEAMEEDTIIRGNVGEELQNFLMMSMSRRIFDEGNHSFDEKFATMLGLYLHSQEDFDSDVPMGFIFHSHRDKDNMMLTTRLKTRSPRSWEDISDVNFIPSNQVCRDMHHQYLEKLGVLEPISK